MWLLRIWKTEFRYRKKTSLWMPDHLLVVTFLLINWKFQHNNVQKSKKIR